MSMISRYKRPGGFVQLLSLIETSTAAKKEKFLEIVRSESESWANAIEQRVLTIPADEGYGSKGFPAWGIPGGATLQFTLECLKIA